MRSNKTGRGTHFMNIREMREAWEADYLSPYASLSRNTKGRDREEAPCDIRGLPFPGWCREFFQFHPSSNFIIR